MSLPHQGGLYKEKLTPTVFRLRPVYNEGRCIRAHIFVQGFSLKKIADNLGVSRVSTHCVVYGKRRSVRIESEIARILGKKSWNEVVLEARSEVQKKPVSVILQEMEQKTQVRRKEAGERMTSQIAQRRSELGWDQTVAQKPKRRRA
jgi:hypothetical protein